MCFSQPGSLAFFVMGGATGLFLRARGHPARRYMLFLNFALMELIQFGGYFVIDQCDNPWNKFFTFAAYTHVMCQNIFVNLFFLCPEFGVHKDVTKLVVSMCIAGAAMGVFTKLPWPMWLGAPVTLIDPLAKVLPEFFSYSTAGTPESCMYESMCGPQVCTFSTPNHIAWSMPILPPSYYLPNSFTHFFFFFFPTAIMGNTMARLTMLAAFVTGPVFTQMLAARHMATYSFEWPATWCYMSVGQCFVGLAMEAWQIHLERKQGPSAECTTKSAAAAGAGVNGSGVSKDEEDEDASTRRRSMPDIVGANAGLDTPSKLIKKKA